MNKKPLSKKINTQIENCLKLYDEKVHMFVQLSKNIFTLFTDHDLLKPYIHSVKWRVKERLNLRNKLERKAFDARDSKTKFAINPGNLLEEIEDLAGVRILHLHTEQIREIDDALRKVFAEQQYIIAKGPIAHTWDYEYDMYFKSLGMETANRDSLYTSVHYIIQASTNLKAEVQVRTLQEEVWGEVSHKINYPIKIESVACQEQIKVLARITSSGTRLVDSIFKSVDECKRLSGKIIKTKK
jgi:putative GTP pyrophosphokinase